MGGEGGNFPYIGNKEHLQINMKKTTKFKKWKSTLKGTSKKRKSKW